MNIEAKPRTLVMLGLVIAIIVGGYFYMKKTAPKRAYVRELLTLRLVEEHTRLEIAVTKNRATLTAMKKAAEAAVPKYNLTPAEAEEKRKFTERSPE